MSVRRIAHKVLLVAALLSAGGALWRALPERAPMGPSTHYLERSLEETGATNVVSAILFDYRGFDTLVEVTVLFAASAGVSCLFSSSLYRSSSEGLSPIAKRSSLFVLPIVASYGLYMTLWGHVSPGGGFQGGAILAGLSVLMAVIYGSDFEDRHVKLKTKERIEALCALGFLLVGLFGMTLGHPYMSNRAAGLPTGSRPHLLSAPFISILNVLVWAKVAAGLSAIFQSLSRELRRP